MTPNFGQGANSAIESAVALANTLHKMINVHHIYRPSDTELDAYLEAFSTPRKIRTRSLVKTAGFVTRLQARDGLLNILIGRYIAPYTPDLPASMAGKVMAGAEKFNYLPVPKRSEKGWPRSRSEKGARGDAQAWRAYALQALQAFGFIMLAAGSVRLFNL